jgi:hypothetical protein
MNPGCEVSFHNRTDIWAERNATQTKFALGTDSKFCFEVAPSVPAFRCTCLCMFHSCCSTFLRPAFMIVFHYSTASFLRNISCSSSPAGHVGSLGSPPSSATLVHSLDEQRASLGLLTLLCLKLCQKSAAPCRLDYWRSLNVEFKRVDCRWEHQQLPPSEGSWVSRAHPDNSAMNRGNLWQIRQDLLYKFMKWRSWEKSQLTGSRKQQRSSCIQRSSCMFGW